MLRLKEPSLGPVKDNTLYEQPRGILSNGAGQHFFAGKTNSGVIKRGVIAFDITGSMPAGSTVTRVSLSLFMSRTQAANQMIELHRLLSDWGEGGSDASGEEGGGARATTGDATWLHTFFDTAMWANPGGDFSATVSASAPVGATSTYTWSSPQMDADVQAWLDQPASNFGWLLLGNESQDQTTKRFDSRENAVAGNRPRLDVIYAPPEPPTPTPTPTPAPTANADGHADTGADRHARNDGDTEPRVGGHSRTDGVIDAYGDAQSGARADGHADGDTCPCRHARSGDRADGHADGDTCAKQHSYPTGCGGADAGSRDRFRGESHAFSG